MYTHRWPDRLSTKPKGRARLPRVHLPVIWWSHPASCTWCCLRLRNLSSCTGIATEGNCATWQERFLRWHWHCWQCRGCTLRRISSTSASLVPFWEFASRRPSFSRNSPTPFSWPRNQSGSRLHAWWRPLWHRFFGCTNLSPETQWHLFNWFVVSRDLELR